MAKSVKKGMTAKENRSVYIREATVRYRKRRVPKKTYHCIGQDASCPDKVASLFRDIQKETVEKCFILHLNTQYIIESFQLVSIGTLRNGHLSPREVFQGALLANADRIICVHNHPSGNAKPSKEDKALTVALENAGEMIGIKLLDHIIIGRNSCYSFTTGGYQEFS